MPAAGSVQRKEEFMLQDKLKSKGVYDMLRNKWSRDQMKLQRERDGKRTLDMVQKLINVLKNFVALCSRVTS